MELIDKQIRERGSYAFALLPFNSKFYFDLKEKGLDSEVVFENGKNYCLKGRKWFKNADSVEHSFRWLIKLGIVRREVDGQGLTSRIRLTPLGRQMIQSNPELPKGKIKCFERIGSYFSFKLQL